MDRLARGRETTWRQARRRRSRDVEIDGGKDAWRPSAPTAFLPLLYQLGAGDGFEVLIVDLFAVGLGNIERIQDLQRHAWIHRPAFGIERAVGGEHDLLQREELQAAFGRGPAAEYRGVDVEVLLEVVERALLEALAQRDVILVAGARAEHVPTRPDAAFQHRHDAAEMVGDDLEVGMVVHDLGEHQAGHGSRGLVRPAERPPDFVERFFLVDIVRHVGPARRMQPDRLAELVHLFPERQILRPVERLAGDVGVDLHAERAELLGRTLRLAHAGVGRIERYLRDPAGKMVAFLRA